MNQIELDEILKNHSEWLLDKGGGKCADLSGCDLRKANLREADLCKADLRESDLREADLTRSYLSEVNLREADFRGANLSGSYIRGANLRGADLTGASLSGVVLTNTTLAECKGLRYAQTSADAFGACGRLITVAIINDEPRWFVGCFTGTTDDLRLYINASLTRTAYNDNNKYIYETRMEMVADLLKWVNKRRFG